MSDERRDLVMTRAAFAHFVQALDAPAEVVPEMVEMFRLARILETDRPYKAKKSATPA